MPENNDLGIILTEPGIDSYIEALTSIYKKNNSFKYTGTSAKIKEPEIKQELKADEVLTYSNTIAKKKDCYYDNRLQIYFLLTDKNLFLDFIDNNYFHTHYYSSYGYITDVKEDLFEIKYSRYVSSCPVTYKNKSYYVTEEFFKSETFSNYFKEDFNTGKFYSYYDKFNEKLNIKNRGIKYISGVNDFFIKNMNLPITYTKMLGKKYTFGCEIETISGLLPVRVLEKLQCSSVFDGSLRHSDDNEAYGYELVTNILQGDQGLKELKKISIEASKRCLINYQCSVHYHIGGDINFSKENIILLYNLCYIIQEELFLMVPKSRRNNEYCKKLLDLNFNINNLNNISIREYNIDYYYNCIIQLMSEKNLNCDNNKKHDHPKGFKCGYDHSSARYSWVNFIPALYNTRSNGKYTIEFRLTNGLLEYNKIKNWLLIYIGILDFVINYKQVYYNSRNIDLNLIMTTVYKNKSEELIDFIKTRKETFSLNKNENFDEINLNINNNLTIESL